MMTHFADQDGKDNRDVSLIDPTRHEVVPDPKQAPRLYGPNRDDDTRGANAEAGRHLVGQDQLAGVHVDNLNMHQESGVWPAKPTLKVDEHDYNKDLYDGSVIRFWDHLRVAMDVAGASSGDPLEHHRHEGDLHEIWDIL
jgi:hypothetical protein